MNLFSEDCCCTYRKKELTEEEKQEKRDRRIYVLDKVCFPKDLQYGNISFHHRKSISNSDGDRKQLFDEYDINEDGKLSKTELAPVISDLTQVVGKAIEDAVRHAQSNLSEGEEAKANDILDILSGKQGKQLTIQPFIALTFLCF
jgi:hypothetical protein